MEKELNNDSNTPPTTAPPRLKTYSNLPSNEIVTGFIIDFIRSLHLYSTLELLEKELQVFSRVLLNARVFRTTRGVHLPPFSRSMSIPTSLSYCSCFLLFSMMKTFKMCRNKREEGNQAIPPPPHCACVMSDLLILCLLSLICRPTMSTPLLTIDSMSRIVMIFLPTWLRHELFSIPTE